MDHAASRTERDIEQLKRDFRETRDLAMRAAVDIAAHKDGCVEASERTQEKIDDVRAAVGHVRGSIDELKADLRTRRQEDDVARRQRQEDIDSLLAQRQAIIDSELKALKYGNRRILIAIAVAAIAAIGTILAKQFAA